MFVTDPKGELAAVTGPHRAQNFGQEVFVLNPWGLHGLPQHRCNPLQPMIEAAGDPALIRGIADEAKALALQLLPEPEDGRNRFFCDGSRTILRGLMLHLATRGHPDLCTLPEMWRVLSSPKRLDRIIKEMEVSDALFGMIADLGAYPLNLLAMLFLSRRTEPWRDDQERPKRGGATPRRSWPSIA